MRLKKIIERMHKEAYLHLLCGVINLTT